MFTKKLLSVLMALVLVLSCVVLPAMADESNATETVSNATPKKITITGKHEVKKGKTITLKAKVYPSGASQKVTWKSSNTKVAKVSSKGVVTGVKAGTATITATSKAKTSIKKTWKITVTSASTKYYALLVGNSAYTYQNPLNGPKYDIAVLSAALKGLKQNWVVTKKGNLTSKQILASITSAFSKATSNDICLFYYSGHGDDSYGSSGGSLAGIECDYYGNGLVSPGALARRLKEACPGKVIVLLDACGSGSYIYNNAGEKVEVSGSPKNFNDAIINAFSYRDEEVVSNTGELIGKKFIVLTASAHGQPSSDIRFTGENFYAGLFTYFLCGAMGCDYPDGHYMGQMYGDSNKDNKLTLGETYTFIKDQISMTRFEQQTQKYGSTSTVLFTR